MLKKNIVLFICVFLLNSGFCSAEVFRIEDDFANNIVIRSNFYCRQNKCKDLAWISFYKTMGNGYEKFNITASSTNYVEYSISKNPIEIKIDNSDICLLDVNNYTVDKSYKNPGQKNISVTTQIEKEIVEKLQNSKRVVLRFTQNGGVRFVYVLPDEALEEWKQVIATKE